MAGPMPGGPSPMPGAPAGQPPGAGKTPPIPKTPLAGPSGPGSSPMVSPGTGAGMKARAMARLPKVIDDLMAMAGEFGAGTPEFKAAVRAIESLNSLLSKKPDTAGAGASPPAPMPIPATPPGGPGGGPSTPTPAAGGME